MDAFEGFRAFSIVIRPENGVDGLSSSMVIPKYPAELGSIHLFRLLNLREPESGSRENVRAQRRSTSDYQTEEART